MTQAAPAHIALATLNHGAQLDGVLSEMLRAAGADIVYEAALPALDFGALKASGARVVVVNLALDQTVSASVDQDAIDDAAVDRAVDQLHADGFDVVFNEVQDVAGVSVEQRARWVRHLVAKILHRPEFILPPQPEGAPGIVSSAPAAVVASAAGASAAAVMVAAPPALANIEPVIAPAEAPVSTESTGGTSSWLDAQDALSLAGEEDVVAAPAQESPPIAPELSWLDAQAALNSASDDEIELPVETQSTGPTLSWQDVQDALEMRTAEDHPPPPLEAHDAQPALSWQDAQDALDFKLLDADDDVAAHTPRHAEEPSTGPDEFEHAPVSNAELVDWDKGFQLVDMEASERPTLELPLPDDLLQAASEALAPKAETLPAADTHLAAPDWGLVPFADEKPSVDVEKEFEAKAMYIPDAANKKRHDFDLNDHDGRNPAESNKDKSS